MAWGIRTQNSPPFRIISSLAGARYPKAGGSAPQGSRNENLALLPTPILATGTTNRRQLLRSHTQKSGTDVRQVRHIRAFLISPVGYFLSASSPPRLRYSSGSAMPAADSATVARRANLGVVNQLPLGSSGSIRVGGWLGLALLFPRQAEGSPARFRPIIDHKAA